MENEAQEREERPFYNNGFLDSNTDIVSKRWESNDFISELWRQLADKEVRLQPNGSTELVRIHPNIEPLMNDRGALTVINLIRSKINTSVVLSNITEEDARTLYGHTMRTVTARLTLDQRRYGIATSSELQFIVDIIDGIVFCQLMRAVKGHESKWSKTQIQEVKQDSNIHQRTSGGLFGSWGNKRGN